MKIIKRNGSEATFDLVKIIAAVTKANNVVAEDARMTPMQIRRIAESVENSCLSMNRALSVEEIQDLVEDQIMAHGAFEVAKNYITRTLVRKSNTTDEKILSLIESNNEEVKQENSNKNPTVNAVQRDYMAGEVSKDLTARVLLPQDIVEAVLGDGNPFAVVLATLIGAPIYADIFSTIPIAEALFGKGVGLGTILAFMMSVTVLSIPSLTMLSRVVKPKLLATFVGICLIGMIISGYVFNWLQPLFV